MAQVTFLSDVDTSVGYVVSLPENLTFKQIYRIFFLTSHHRPQYIKKKYQLSIIIRIHTGCLRLDIIQYN